MDQVVDPVYQNHPHRRHCRSIDCAYMNCSLIVLNEYLHCC